MRNGVWFWIVKVITKRISAATATRIPPRKLLVCPGAELGPPPWDDVTPSDIKTPLKTPRALALPRHCAPTGVVTTHQKPAESNRDDLSDELAITGDRAGRHVPVGHSPRPAQAPTFLDGPRQSQQCCKRKNP